MAKHIWSVLCSRGILDEYRKSISLVDVIESISIAVPAEHRERFAAEKPVIIPCDFTLVSYFIRTDTDSPEDVSIRLKIMGPHGEETGGPLELPVDLVTARGARSLIWIRQFPFFGWGDYWLLVELRTSDAWVEVARVPLEIKEEATEKANGPNEPARPS